MQIFMSELRPTREYSLQSSLWTIRWMGASSCGCHQVSLRPLQCWHNGPTNKVSTVAGIEVMHELRHMDFHSLRPVQLSVQFISVAQLCLTLCNLWTAARQASLSVTNSQSLLKFIFIESVMPSNHLILCPPLLSLPSIFPSIRVFSNESILPIRWPKYWSFSFSISPSNEYSGLISFIFL